MGRRKDLVSPALRGVARGHPGPRFWGLAISWSEKFVCAVMKLVKYVGSCSSRAATELYSNLTKM